VFSELFPIVAGRVARMAGQSSQQARNLHNRLVCGSSPAGPTTHSDTNRRFPVSDE